MERGERMIHGTPRFIAGKGVFDEGCGGEHRKKEFAKQKIQVAGPMLGEYAYAPFTRGPTDSGHPANLSRLSLFFVATLDLFHASFYIIRKYHK